MPKSHVTDAQRAEMARLHSLGKTSREIGEAIGITTGTAANIIFRLGLKSCTPKKTNPGSIKKPKEAPERKPFVSPAQAAAAAGWRPMSNRDRVSLDIDISRAIAAVRLNPKDELAKERLLVLIGRRDRDDCARQAQRVAA